LKYGNSFFPFLVKPIVDLNVAAFNLSPTEVPKKTLTTKNQKQANKRKQGKPLQLQTNSIEEWRKRYLEKQFSDDEDLSSASGSGSGSGDYREKTGSGSGSSGDGPTFDNKVEVENGEGFGEGLNYLESNIVEELPPMQNWDQNAWNN
jgi:hypothetical protein